MENSRHRKRKSKTMERLFLDWHNNIKISILPKFIYRFNALSIKITMSYCTDLEKKIQEFIWNYKRLQIAKAVLQSNNIVGVITISDLKLYYRAIMTKTVW